MIFEPPRFVKARKPYNKIIPMVVVDHDLQAWSDFDSVPMPRPLVDVLTECKTDGHTGRHPSSILVCSNPIRLLLQLQKHFKDNPEWNFKISIHDKDTYVNGAIRTTKDHATVSFVGFRDEHKNTWYHYIIAPSRYTRNGINELVPGEQPEIAKLYEWGQSLYKFAGDNKIKLSGSAGGVAAQFLRDSRFYPKARRKVPIATNERAREALPGNFYEMRGELKRVYAAAVYFDQENAHHYAAATIQLPHADWLYARGYFHCDKEWCNYGSPEFDYVINQEYGLLYARIWVPKHLDGYLPQWAWQPGFHNVYLFTNELDLVKELGVEIRALFASWTSPVVDTGLSKYSEWAREQIKKNPQDKKWLKSVLLATYGVLASKPRRYEFGYYRADGKYTPFELGPHEIQIVRTVTKRENQLPVANVIHRGMIEAETRKISIQLARQFEKEKRNVISIYADGVIVSDRTVRVDKKSGEITHHEPEQYPLLSEPWRAKHKLSNVTFTDSTSFESELLSKRPGRRRLDKA